MLKPNLLRAALSKAVPYLRDNPDKLAVWLEKGTVVSTGQQSLSFEYRYTLHVIVADYAASIDSITVPTLLWLHRHQPDIISNPDKCKTGFTFEADILNSSTADIFLYLELTEAVIVKEIDGELAICHRDEPQSPHHSHLEKWEIAFTEEQIANG